MDGWFLDIYKRTIDILKKKEDYCRIKQPKGFVFKG